MAARWLRLSPAKRLFAIIAIIVLTNIAVFADVAVLREICGFIFLTFVPGFLILSAMKLNSLNWVEITVLSVGLSVAFIMLFGLCINATLPVVGYTEPLSKISLLISFSLAAIILAVIAFVRNGHAISFPSPGLTVSEKAFLIVPALFPLASILGMRLMNLTDNNIVLMLLLFLIPAYVIFISFLKGKVSEKVYPVAIFMISISLLLIYSLRSNHLIGADVHREYFMFLTIMDNLKWGQIGFGNLDACLSITMLPAVYQTFLNIAPEYLYKIFYSLIFSFSPLIVYLIARKYVGSFYAFLASFFFMSQLVFQSTPSGTRSIIAILFFSLIILVIFHGGIGVFVKRALFIIFTAAIIVSHYGVTYVTVSLLIFTWLGTQIVSMILSRKKAPGNLSNGSQAGKGSPSPLPLRGRLPLKNITITMVFLFAVMLFFWHSQMTGPSFRAGVYFVYRTFTSWQWFLAEGVGEQPVQAAFGETFSYTGVPQRIELVFSWLTVFLMSVGLLAAIFRRFRAMISAHFAGYEKPDYLSKELETEYLVLSIGCYSLLVAAVVLPYLAESYGISRMYFQMVIPLSIFLIIGGVEVAKYLKSRPQWLLIAVLVPYFLCTTGAICQVFGFPRLITLNSEGPQYDGMYISDGENYAARWLKEHAEQERAIYAEGIGGIALQSQGGIYSQVHGAFIPRYQKGKEINGYLYLRHTDLVVNEVTREYPEIFAGKSRIYAAGDSEIYN